MSTTKDQIIDLIAHGVPTSQIAAAVGCTDAYVSQLKSDPDIQTLLAQRGVETTVKDVAFDTALERAEYLALEKVEKNLPFANFGQALAAFKVLNSARRRKDVLAAVDMGTTINVNLTLPATALPRYTLNAQSELIEVDGKTMLTATPKSLDQILAARAAGDAVPAVTSIERAAKLLDSMGTQRPRLAPRKLPSALSADVL